jgi:hypothetical protein
VGSWVRVVGKVPLGGSDLSVPARHVDALRKAVALVPADVPVSSSNIAGAHLSARRYVYTIPVLGRAQWIVLDTKDPWIVTPDSPLLTRHPKEVRAFERRIEGSSQWTRVLSDDGVLVFRRT